MDRTDDGKIRVRVDDPLMHAIVQFVAEAKADIAAAEARAAATAESS